LPTWPPTKKGAYDFYKGFLEDKMTQSCHISRRKEVEKATFRP